jgi:hypothetical protein
MCGVEHDARECEREECVVRARVSLVVRVQHDGTEQAGCVREYHLGDCTNSVNS